MWKSRTAFTLTWYPRWVIKFLKPRKVYSYKNNFLSLMSLSSPVIFLLFDTNLREELSVLTLIPLLQLPLTLWSTTLRFLSLIELWKCSYHPFSCLRSFPLLNPMEIFLALYIYIATPFLVKKFFHLLSCSSSFSSICPAISSYTFFQAHFHFAYNFRSSVLHF